METEVIVKEIPESVITEANAAFQQGFALLMPYMQAITTEDGKKLFKMADGTEPFVNKGVEFIQSNPEFIPVYLKVDNLNAGLTVYKQLLPFFNMFTSFSSLVVDTRTIARAQALKEVLKYYDTVKTSMENRVAGAKAIFDELKKRFKRKKSKETATENKEETTGKPEDGISVA